MALNRLQCLLFKKKKQSHKCLLTHVAEDLQVETKEEKNTDLNSNGGKFPSIIQGFGYKILQFRL